MDWLWRPAPAATAASALPANSDTGGLVWARLHLFVRVLRGGAGWTDSGGTDGAAASKASRHRPPRPVSWPARVVRLALRCHEQRKAALPLRLRELRMVPAEIRQAQGQHVDSEGPGRGGRLPAKHLEERLIQRPDWVLLGSPHPKEHQVGGLEPPHVLRHGSFPGHSVD
jgi:hypothetical protein